MDKITVADLLTCLRSQCNAMNDMTMSLELYEDGSGSVKSGDDIELVEFKGVDDLLAWFQIVSVGQGAKP